MLLAGMTVGTRLVACSVFANGKHQINPPQADS